MGALLSLGLLVGALSVLLVLVASSRFGILPLIAIGVLIGAIVAVRSPRAFAVAMVVLWGGPIDLALTTRSFAGLQVSFGAIALGTGLFGVIARRVIGKGPQGSSAKPRFFWPITLYLTAATWGLLVAFRAGDPVGASANTAVIVFSITSYFLFREAYHGRPKTLANDLVLVTGLMAAIAVSSRLLGITWLSGRDVGHVITEGTYLDVTRIDPPLLRILSITLLMATFGGVLRRGRWRWFRWPIIAAMVAVEALSMTRSTWTPLILVAVLLPVTIARRWPLTVLAERVVVAALVGVGAIGLAASGAVGQQSKAAADRLLSVSDSEALNDTSVLLRVWENEAAIAQIQANPLVGVGFPRQYGIYTVGVNQETYEDIFEPQRFIHNSYLGAWLWLGAPGVIAVLALFGSCLRAGYLVIASRSLDRAPPLATLGGLMVLAVSSSFQTNLIYPPAYLALGAGLGFVDVWLDARRLPTPSMAAAYTRISR